eukprot:TRINITY_DN21651_c0_g1_i1.p1 TRINITY_DN21651_c0_g1~~TRINITY_DN21651_c0_g1_i1.p1  ORF type:complete len:123 (-),score=45.25 TRINITY_DN21651_c0_g1_i1:5-373(-)
MGIVHDLAECLVGDITPADGISQEEKFDLENKAMLELKNTLSDELGTEIYNLWREYSDGVTEEAKMVKELDKLEMIFQADVYQREQQVDLSRFFETTKEKFKNKEIIPLAQQIYKENGHQLL